MAANEASTSADSMARDRTSSASTSEPSDFPAEYALRDHNLGDSRTESGINFLIKEFILSCCASFTRSL